VIVEFFGERTLRRYANPVETIAAYHAPSVELALRRCDDALANGYSIAGFLTHEAGCAFEAIDVPALPPHRPLLEIGVYGGWSEADASMHVTGTEDHAALLGPLVTEIGRERYERDLATIDRAIRSGDVYQVNYTVPFAFTFGSNWGALFARLRAGAGVRYAASVRSHDRAIVSLSPELFLGFDGRHVWTRPMKGTSAPDDTAQLDTPKNRAEHVMIVDLLRNDLHRVCDDVSVRALFDVERYPTFATAVTTIDGMLTAGRRFSDVVRATFPCGSVTGAPKISALGYVARTERAPRDVAMGSIGYCDPGPRGMWNVAIRTLDLDLATGVGTARVGGGIVADSNVTDEWAEILIKRRAFDALVRPFGLLETLRVEVDGTMPRLEAHLARLERSAFAFGITVDVKDVRELLLSSAKSSRTGPALARVTIERDGSATIDERDLISFGEVAKLHLTSIALRSDDPTLRYKTTMRNAYDEALRLARRVGAAEGLLVNEAGRIADGSRTSLFVEIDGRLATPPLEDGAVEGILRAELLARQAAVERSLCAADLVGRKLFIGNAARGLVPARLGVARR